MRLKVGSKFFDTHCRALRNCQKIASEEEQHTLHHCPGQGASGCTPETLVSPRHTRPEFSSNPKPCKEIIQTPTPLQVVWFPPHTTFLIYHHPKLNRNQPSPPRGNSKYRITPTGFFCHPDKTHPVKVHPDKANPIKFYL